jgi:hypothetical protein
MRRIGVCMCLLLMPSAAHAANPLAPLAKLHTALTKGLSAVIKGVDITRAFKPLTVKARRHLVDDIKEAGGVTARVLSMKIDLVFHQEATASYLLQTEVFPAPRGPVLVTFKGHGSETPNNAFPFAKYRGAAAPLGAAAAQLAKSAVGSSCARMPVAKAADFPFMPEGKLTDQMKHSLQHTRRHLAGECEKLAALEKPSRVELRVDDVSFGVLGSDGKLVGIVKGQLELASGALVLELGRFQPIETTHPRRHPRDEPPE